MQSDPLPWRPGAAWRSDATACLAVAAVLAAVGQALATWQPTELQSGEPGWLLVAAALYWRVGRGGRIAWWLLVTVATLATAVFTVSPLVAPVGFQLHRAERLACAPRAQLLVQREHAGGGATDREHTLLDPERLARLDLTVFD